MKRKLSRWNLATWLGLIALHIVVLAGMSLLNTEDEPSTTDPHLSEQPESKDPALDTKTWIFPSSW